MTCREISQQSDLPIECSACGPPVPVEKQLEPEALSQAEVFARSCQLPELPEVETMVRGIRPHVTGRLICEVTRCPSRCKPISITPAIARMKKRLVGRQISAVRRLGKRVVLDFENGSNLVIEPRMTGLVLLANPPDVEHLRLKWELAGTGEFDAFWFWDRRGLGTVRLWEPGTLDQEYGPQKLGPDALEMTVAHWSDCCAKTTREIKVMLLDQKIVAGIGNLYASEILHRAAIHPAATAKSLKPKFLERLADSVQTVLLKAIECEGSTLGDGTYRNALSQSGSYQHQHQVYMREGQSCFACGKEMILRIVQAQRSTFFCPRCQKP